MQWSGEDWECQRNDSERAALTTKLGLMMGKSRAKELMANYTKDHAPRR